MGLDMGLWVTEGVPGHGAESGVVCPGGTELPGHGAGCVIACPGGH